MQTMPNFAHLGSGRLLIREYGSAAGFQPVGNCSAISVSPQSDDITLADYTKPGGGTYAKASRVSDIQISYTFHDFHPENLARALRGSIDYLTAGTVTAESVTAYKGGYIPLARVATAITSVTDDDGTTTYTAGTDYVLDNGVLYIPATSTIDAGETLKVTYTAPASGKVQAFSVGQKDYEMLFLGETEVNTTQRKTLRCHKVSGGVLEEMALIGDDMGEGSVTGSLQSDPSKYVAGSTNSQYFWLDVVGATDPALA